MCQYIRWLVVETSGLAIESTMWLFAFVLIWDLNAQLHRRMKLLLIFAARLAYVFLASCISRILTLTQSDSNHCGPPRPSTPVGLPAHDRRHRRSQHPCPACAALGPHLRVSNLPETLPPNMARKRPRGQQYITVLECAVRHVEQFQYKRSQRG